MAFTYRLMPLLEGKLRALGKKDPPLRERVRKKILEVASRNTVTIEFYKNLRAPLQAYKRVQVGSFVLTFQVFKNENFIQFADFDHHDNIY